MTRYFHSPTAEIYYDSELDTLFLKYLNKVKNDQDFIEVNSQVLKVFCQLNTQKFVADIRKMGIISISSQQWVVNTLLPGMFKHLKGKRLYHAQYLDKSDIMSRVSGSNIKNKSNDEDSGFAVEQFSDEESLREYLLNLT